jgi:putative DNA primase/helicase
LAVSCFGQLSERPIVKIRILGQSAMPDCECRTAVFATGNNIGFKGDMVRRGLVCSLEALSERRSCGNSITMPSRARHQSG